MSKNPEKPERVEPDDVDKSKRSFLKGAVLGAGAVAVGSASAGPSTAIGGLPGVGVAKTKEVSKVSAEAGHKFVSSFIKWFDELNLGSESSATPHWIIETINRSGGILSEGDEVNIVGMDSAIEYFNDRYELSGIISDINKDLDIKNLKIGKILNRDFMSIVTTISEEGGVEVTEEAYSKFAKRLKQLGLTQDNTLGEMTEVFKPGFKNAFRELVRLVRNISDDNINIDEVSRCRTLLDEVLSTLPKEYLGPEAEGTEADKLFKILTNKYNKLAIEEDRLNREKMNEDYSRRGIEFRSKNLACVVIRNLDEDRFMDRDKTRQAVVYDIIKRDHERADDSGSGFDIPRRYIINWINEKWPDAEYSQDDFIIEVTEYGLLFSVPPNSLVDKFLRTHSNIVLPKQISKN